jgi:hypothetical protein
MKLELLDKAVGALRVPTRTEMKVAGRKIMVRSAMDFMTLLSWRARLL